MTPCSAHPVTAACFLTILAPLAVPVAAGRSVPPSAAYADDGASMAAVNVDRQHVIIRGYDPVAYFTENKAVIGSPEFKADYQDAT